MRSMSAKRTMCLNWSTTKNSSSQSAKFNFDANIVNRLTNGSSVEQNIFIGIRGEGGKS